MQLIEINSPEYRAFVVSAIANNERYILEQLRLARLEGKPKLRLLEDCFDHIQFSSTLCTDEEEKAREALESVIFTSKPYYEALTKAVMADLEKNIK